MTFFRKTNRVLGNATFITRLQTVIELDVYGWLVVAEPSEGGVGGRQTISDGACQSAAESVPRTAHTLAGGQGTLPHRGKAF